MRKGLTLMEILTVISILATLAALLYPVYWNLRTKSDLVVCADQLRQIGIALKMYARDWGDETPYAEPYLGLGALYPHYIRDDNILICPTFRKAAPKLLLEDIQRIVREWGWNRWWSYFYFRASGIDKTAKRGDPYLLMSFAEIYAKRGDQIPIVMCATHWRGCPLSNISLSGIHSWSPNSPFFNCWALANPNAPFVILRWSGQVNFVYGGLKSTDIILLTY